MVNKKHSDDDATIDMEIHEDGVEIEVNETELRSQDKIKHLQIKIKELETETRKMREESARTKADFLNAKKRLEEERKAEIDRQINRHIERLLPLCDSFYLAMLDKETWAKADDTWRKGIEGIHAQLQSILDAYDVSSVDPTGESFDPNIHEALHSEPTTDRSKHNLISSVIQLGYIRKTNVGDRTIRPARVTVAEYTE